MYLVKTPKVIQRLFPNYTWTIPSAAPTIHLTFDDGPIPEVTPWVLEMLSEYQAKATFFCVGDNVRKHPEVLREVIAKGHTVGNHTYNHLSGWNTEHLPYFHNVRHCAQLVQSDLFRPPYGRLRPKQAQFLQRHYQIVMWDVLSGDFDPAITNEQCLHNVTQNAQSGSIVVFHDSIKAEEKLRYVLPRVLKHFSERGFQFNAIQPGAQSEYQGLRRSA